MANWIIVRKNDLKMMGSYESDIKKDSFKDRSYLLAEPICEHIELPEGMYIDCIKIQLNEETSEIEIVVDADAIQPAQKVRNDKLARFRELRQPLLDEVDVMVNELVLDIRADKEAIVAYRDALKAATDDYKYVSDSNKAKAAMDAVDVENYSWPEKP